MASYGGASSALATMKSPEFRSLKAKIRVLCKQRRIRLEEFMRTFDIHRVKKIKVDQFKRALDVSGLNLSPTEVNLIVTKYRIPDDPSFINYRKFCDLIDKVFTVKGLEAKPDLKTVTGKTRDELPASEKQFAIASLNDAESQQLHAIKEKLAEAVRTKGIVIKDVFRDFDRSNAGKVTKTQFVRDLLDIVTLSTKEVDLLLKAYGNDLDVHYRALHYDISPSALPKTDSNSPIARSPGRRQQSSSAPASLYGSDLNVVLELEAELSEIALRDRIRTKNFFTDFDPLRTGKCTEAQFKRCVKLCFGTLTEPQLDLLTLKYRIEHVDCKKVDYMRFCNYIEGKSNQTNAKDDQYADILSSLTLPKPSQQPAVKCTRDQRGSLSENESDVFNNMMQRLSSFCSTRRILLKPLFQDFDKGRREYVTIEQFFRVMTMLKLTLSSEQERRVLLKRYASVHGDRFVNYVTFCTDIDQWDALSASNQGSSIVRPSSRGGNGVVSEILSPTRIRTNTFEETASLSHVRSVPMLLRYIKQIVKRDRIRLEEYYRDSDKLRHGTITRAQFCAGLSTGGLILSKEEMKLLGDEYVSQSPDQVDSQGQQLIAWKRFVDEIESVFTVKGLERNPNPEVVVSLVNNTTGGSTSMFGGMREEKELTSDEEQRVTQAVVSMKTAIDRQRLNIKPLFEDFDRSKQGFISATKFERVLSMFQLLPSDPAITRLVEIKFREQLPNSSKLTLSSICDVNYRAFLQALEFIGNHNNTNTKDLRLPSSVDYRQFVVAHGGNGNAGTHAVENSKRSTRDIKVTTTDLQQLLIDLCAQLQAKRIRLKEFIMEGDKLRSGEITIAKFHTALNRSGCILDAADVNTLTIRFRSARNPDKIDWRGFLDAVDQASCANAAGVCDEEVQAVEPDARVAGILERLRLEVNHRRLHMKPYFQDYDHNKVSRVTKFQFAAVLDMMKLNLKPHEIELLGQQYALRHGRKITSDVNYLAFIQAVDSDYS